MDYTEKFIIEAGKVCFTTADGQRWRMRQPTPEEAADGDSAYRLAHRRVMEDGRLMDLAGSPEALEREARIRASAAEAVYLLPVLLEVGGQGPRVEGQEETWRAAFNVFDPASMAEFEDLPGPIVAEMTQVYWGPILAAVKVDGVSSGFVSKVGLCRQWGRWPFASPPEAWTLAQALLYDKALKQLGDKNKSGAKPQRLRGEAWQAIKERAQQ